MSDDDIVCLEDDSMVSRVKFSDNILREWNCVSRVVNKLKSGFQMYLKSDVNDEDCQPETCFRSEAFHISEEYDHFLNDYHSIKIETSPLRLSDVPEPNVAAVELEGKSASPCIDVSDCVAFRSSDVDPQGGPMDWASVGNSLLADEREGTVLSPVEPESKILTVKCLQSIEELQEICQKEGLKFKKLSNRDAFSRLCKRWKQDDSVNYLQDENTAKEVVYWKNRSDDSEDEEAYEVEMIVDHKFQQGEAQYFVKWVSYNSCYNTWEPKCHLNGCHDLIEYYEALKSSKTTLNKKLLHFFLRDLTTRKPIDILTLTKLCALSSKKSEDFVSSLRLSTSQLKSKARELNNLSDSKLSRMSKNVLEIMRFYEKRKKVLIKIQEWKVEINLDVDPSKCIEVENNADLELPPYNFQFIQDYTSVCASLTEDPVAFCKCTNCFENQRDCCPHNSEGYFAYNKYGRLKLKPGYPIYECNKFCSCDSSCINRVVQHGPKVRVAIFRTSNGCGWGLKTLEPIEEGTFVLEYLGEIITSETAEARGNVYDYVGRSYLFDLDYGVDSCSFTVDAGHVGNATHFINHSCNPNLHVFAVWINNPDPNLPRLAFFATRKIKRYEELTFDYKMVNSREKPKTFTTEGALNSPSATKKTPRIRCKCNARNCRKYLF